MQLEAERKNCDFDKEELTLSIFGGKEKLDKYLRDCDRILNDPVMLNHPSFYEMTREEKIETLYKKHHRLYQLLEEDISYRNIVYYMNFVAGGVIFRFLISLIASHRPPSWHVWVGS